MKTTLQTLKNIFLSNRFKSFYWRVGMMFVAGLIQLTIESLSSFQLSDQVTIVLGLILGEISKAINKAIIESKNYEQ